MSVVPATDVPDVLKDLPNFEAHSEVFTDMDGFADGTHYVQAHINDAYYVGYGMSDAAAFADMLANNEDIQAAIDATRTNGQHTIDWFYDQSSLGGELGGGAVPDTTEFTPLTLDMGTLALSVDHLVVA